MHLTNNRQVSEPRIWSHVWPTFGCIADMQADMYICQRPTATHGSTDWLILLRTFLSLRWQVYLPCLGWEGTKLAVKLVLRKMTKLVLGKRTKMFIPTFVWLLQYDE